MLLTLQPAAMTRVTGTGSGNVPSMSAIGDELDPL
jgi:hypothetical protein